MSETPKAWQCRSCKAIITDQSKVIAVGFGGGLVHEAFDGGGYVECGPVVAAQPDETAAPMPDEKLIGFCRRSADDAWLNSNTHTAEMFTAIADRLSEVCTHSSDED